jgi:O-antigen ligase
MKRDIFRAAQTLRYGSHDGAVHFVKCALSYYGMVVCLLALAAVLISYMYGLMQPVRWPSVIYFLLALLVTLFSRRLATFLLIFSLPLLPDLHIQISYIKSPAVPYFVNYPGLDVSIGYAVGLLLSRLIDRGNDLKSMLLPPWPAGLLLLMLTISAAAAVARNLWQINADFSLIGLLNNALRFKLINPLNDYFPIANLIIHAVAILLFTLLLQVLKQDQRPNEVVFRPVVLAAGVAAIWGIVQGLTAFGLSEQTIDYRPASWGYGATGFQPDIHAFGAHMLIGTVGLFGYIALPHARSWRSLVLLVMVLCCVALVLSKSRASTFLLVLSTGLFVFLMLRQKQLTPRLLKAISICVAIVALVGFSQTFAWMREINAALDNPSTSWFQKVNEISRYRLEIFLAAMRLFATAPFFGIGNGNFLRVSRDPEVTGTSWFIGEGGKNAYIEIEGGDNAHNYFLQTLAETGLIGISVCTLFFIYPFLTKVAIDRVRTVLWGMIAIALGNLYSHSLVIRENLFLLAVFCALFYAGVTRRNEDPVLNDSTARICSLSFNHQLLGIIVLVVIGGFSLKEFRNASEGPANAGGYACLRPSQDTAIDGWSSGIYKTQVPIGARYVHYLIDDAYGTKLGESSLLRFGWYDENRNLIKEELYPISGAKFPIKIRAQVPATIVDAPKESIVVVTSNFCFTPANHSFVDDVRRLSMKVRNEIEF